MRFVARHRWIALTVLAVTVGVMVGGTSVWVSSRHLRHPTPTSALSPFPEGGDGLVTVIVHPPSGPPRTWQLLHADTTPLILHGLMGASDPSVGGHHGMFFEFAHPTMAAFWMKDTKLALSLALFDLNGRMQSRTIDMTPCGDSDNCPRYTASTPFLYAMEVPQHDLSSLGLVAGSSITVPSP